VYRQVIDWLALPFGASVLEAGSGAGGFTSLLADAVALGGGKVTALDESREMLDSTRDLVQQGGHGELVSYQQGDIGSLPFESGLFDLAWASRAVHHVPDQLAGVKELARVVAPGGRLVLREGIIGTRFLPDDIGLGAPGLEDRLNVGWHRWFTSNVRAGNVRYPFGWTQMLVEAGLSDVTAKTFMLEALSPFTDFQIAYMGRHLRRWVEDDKRKAMLDADDVSVLTALTDPASDAYVFKRSDLYLQEMVTVYVGTARQQ
jgi:SAM-dependent methyltransferase